MSVQRKGSTEMAYAYLPHPYMQHREWTHCYIPGLFGSSGQVHKDIIEDAVKEAQDQAIGDYPYAVLRDEQQVHQRAQQACKQWIASIDARLPNQIKKTNNPELITQTVQAWNSFKGEAEHVYVSAFVNAYSEQVAKKDKEKEEQERKERAGQPATPTGATITVIREDHNTPNVHKYWVRIADPIHFGEAQDFPLPLVVDFSEAPATD